MRCEICNKIEVQTTPCKECEEIIFLASHTMDYEILELHPDENGPKWIMWDDEEDDE